MQNNKQIKYHCTVQGRIQAVIFCDFTLIFSYHVAVSLLTCLHKHSVINQRPPRYTTSMYYCSHHRPFTDKGLGEMMRLIQTCSGCCSKAQSRINPCRTLSPALPLMLQPGDMSKQSLVERSPPAKTTKAISHPWQCLEQKRHSREPQEGCKSEWRQSSVGKLPVLCCLLGAFLSAFGASSPSLLKSAHDVNTPH